MSNTPAQPDPRPRGRHRAVPPPSEPENVTPLTEMLPVVEPPVSRRELRERERSADERKKHQRASTALATGSFLAVTGFGAAFGVQSVVTPARVESSETSQIPVVRASAQEPVSAGDAPVGFPTPRVGTEAAPPPPPPPPPPAPKPAPVVVPAQGQPKPAPVAPPPPPVVEAKAGLVWPLATVRVNSPFGMRGGVLHTGIDLFGACGTAVYAAGSGKVVESGWSVYGGGNRVVVDHGGGIKTTYNHLNSIAVGVGVVVGQGALIGGVGSTGNSTGCHLHFEVLVNGNAVNPASMLP